MKTNITTVGFTHCNHCNLDPTKEGHDACLGTLPNVMNACCGHGDVNLAYVQFNHKDYQEDSNKQRLSGQVALDVMNQLKSGVPE